MCVRGRCLCPSGYRAVAKDTKCAKIGGGWLVDGLVG